MFAQDFRMQMCHRTGTPAPGFLCFSVPHSGQRETEGHQEEREVCEVTQRKTLRAQLQALTKQEHLCS